ncbi:hypothetical protein SDC9_194231 [bioreactor metagenome]|uniref:Uncharacterized protein n=1 Tax=bioreactor metagenome TaxID=1076179 RepID=A0A645I6B0_9ZZZZ
MQSQGGCCVSDKECQPIGHDRYVKAQQTIQTSATILVDGNRTTSRIRMEFEIGRADACAVEHVDTVQVGKGVQTVDLDRGTDPR